MFAFLITHSYNNTLCSAESRTFHAKINDQLNILCANPELHLGTINDDLYKDIIGNGYLEQDIYFTDQKRVYEHRNTSTARLIHHCKVSMDLGY